MPNLSDHIRAELHEGIRAGTTTLLVIPFDSELQRLYDAVCAGVEKMGSFGDTFTEKLHRKLCAENFPFPPNSTHHIEGVGSIRVTAIDCKRLQEIGEEEALKAGIWLEREDGERFRHELDNGWADVSAADAFCDYWCNAHGDESYEANPMCWYVTIEKEGGSDGS